MIGLSSSLFQPTALGGSNLVFVQLFNGLVLGASLVLAALGLSLIFGLLNVVNFAHGALALIGAYVAWEINKVTGNFLVGLIAAPVVAGVIGLSIERFTLRRIYDRDQVLQLLLTFGFAEFITGLVEAIWGSDSKSLPIPSWGTGTVNFGLFTYPIFRLFLLVVAVLIVVGLFLFITRTDLGLIVRAGIEDREMVAVLGIDVSKIYLLVFGLGCALAGLAGGFLGPMQGVDLALGVDILVPAFVVVVVGGMGSLVGSVVAGLLIGELIAITSLVAPAASQVVIYVFMAIVLLVRPRGFFGAEEVL